MNLSALKTKVPPPWTNAGLAPLIALALIAGARTAQAQEPAATTSDEQPDGRDCSPPAGDPTGIGDPSATTATIPTGGVGAGSPECQVPPDNGPGPGGASGGGGVSDGETGSDTGNSNTGAAADTGGSDTGDGPGGGTGRGTTGGPGTGGGGGGGGGTGGYTGGGGAAGPGGPGGTAHHGTGGPGHHNGSGGTDTGERHPNSASHSP